MTNHPYTEEDLRAEAARQHADLTRDPDFVRVGEQMEDTQVKGTQTWGSLLAGLPDPDGVADAYEVAQCAIHDLITGAADVSEWAVTLGADGLEPEAHAITLDGDGEPLVRLHLAFHPDMDDVAREGFAMRLARVMAADI